MTANNDDRSPRNPPAAPHDQTPRDRARAGGASSPHARQSPPGDEPREPCHVGIVFALAQEAGGLIDRLAGCLDIVAAEFKVREGGLARRRVAAIVSGPCRKAAAKATETLIAGHDPRWVISSGFAGGLTDAVGRGDIVVADEIVDVAGNNIRVDVPAELANVDSAELIRAAAHVGRFVTVDEIVTTPAAKRALAEAHAAVAVDMESLAVAEVCRRENRRFLSIRIASDAVGDALPPEVSNLMKQKSLAGQFGAVAGALFKRPSSIKDLYRLKEDALIASDRLAKFLEAVVAKL